MDHAIKVMTLIFYAVATLAIGYTSFASWLSSRRHKKMMLEYETDKREFERMVKKSFGIEERANLAVVTEIQPPPAGVSGMVPEHGVTPVGGGPTNEGR